MRKSRAPERVRIDAERLIDVRLSEDGTRLALNLLDRSRQPVSLSLPAGCLNALITAAPGTIENGTVHPLDSWTIGPAANGQDLVLTLRTPEGVAVRFAIKPWQVEGMATLATYGRSNRTVTKTVH
jgi:hypothetical protein